MEQRLEVYSVGRLTVEKKRKEDGRYIYYYFPEEDGGER